jgi:DNA-binding MarR family transcriptional regulator
MGTHTKISLGDDVTAILDAIRQIVHLLRIGSRAAEKQVGLSGARLFVLAALGDGPVATLNELAKRTRTHQSSVSVVVQRLVDAGLVERVRGTGDDGRRLGLRLTPVGRARLRDAPDPAQTRLIAAIERMGPAERSMLATLLSQLAGRLDAGASKAATMFFEDDGGRPGSMRARPVSARQRKRKGLADGAS